MYEISTELYRQVADRLVPLIAEKEYFSGSFEFHFGEIRCRMILSAIIFNGGKITPVWWEFRTYNQIEMEMNNDFSFSELLNHINTSKHYENN